MHEIPKLGRILTMPPNRRWHATVAVPHETPPEVSCACLEVVMEYCLPQV